MNTPVKFELAKLLKEKRFDVEVRDYYEEKDGTFYHSQYFRDNVSINEKHKGFVVAPTIGEVVIWLYEKHGIWISVDPENDKDTWFHTVSYNKSETIFGNYNTYNSPTEAYEAAIKYALNNIL